MKVLYFGIYDPEFGRNRIYIKGLREIGVEVLECRDTAKGLRKYWNLWKKHHKIRNSYDALVVGYPGHLVVPLAKFLSKKVVVADLLGSLEDAEVNSRNASAFRLYKSRIIDRLAVWFADIILLESEAQKHFFEKKFGVSKKYKVLYTGADDSVFHCDSRIKKDPFIVLFRGRLTKESGITYVLEAAKLLKNEKGITFRIIGFGQLLEKTKEIIERDSLTKVELISELLPEDELREKMCEASVSLGQFEDNPRLSRTIPHKAFESLAMGIPYLSGDAPAIREIIKDGGTGFLVPLANAEFLAVKIRELYARIDLDQEVSLQERKVFDLHFSPSALADELRKFFK